MTEILPKPDAHQLERVAALLRFIPEGSPLDQLLKGAAHLERPPIYSAALASDILHGADQIASFIFGDIRHRRKVYRLVEAHKLPHFRLGASICSRKSVLISWISAQHDGGGR